MQDVRKQLQTVDQPRTGTREVGGSVDGHDSPGCQGSQGSQLACVSQCLRVCARGVPADPVNT